MEGSFDRDVRPYLDLVNSLRQVGVHQDTSLPQIAVMGDQSSGKSSVLQSLCGVPFPSGSGLVTRCPTQLILTKSAPNIPWRAKVTVNYREQGRSQPPGTGPVGSVQELCGVITTLTNTLTKGLANNFSSDMIVIELSSPESPDLTIIDLPGIIRTTTSGQNVAVVREINDLIDSYIIQENTIILAVIPSNQDIATIDILERASQGDPTGARTLGVLTKPDLIGDGNEEELVQVLNNIRKPLLLGYVMVKNLNQKEASNIGNKEGWSVTNMREKEVTYFQQHPHFSKLPSTLFGISNLSKKLTTLLVKKIKTVLPSIKLELKSMVKATDDDLKHSNLAASQSLLLTKVSEFCRLMHDSSKGDYRNIILASNQDYRFYATSQKILSEFQDKIPHLRPEGSNNQTAMQKLESEIKGHRGRDPPGFLNSQVFYSEILVHAEKWRSPVETCLSDMISLSHRTLQELSASCLNDLPSLSAVINSITANAIDEIGDVTALKLDGFLTQEQTPFSAPNVLLELINATRFRAFDSVLSDILDGIPAPSSLTSFQNNSSSSSSNKNNNNNTNNNTNANSKYSNTNNANYNQSQVQNQNNAIAESNTINSKILQDDVKNKLSQWYVQRHGVHTDGNVHEMATIIQSYWDISSRRLMDNVCMCLEAQFLSKLVATIESECMIYSLGLSSADVKNVLCEEPSAVVRRDNLKLKKIKLEKALLLLEKKIG